MDGLTDAPMRAVQGQAGAFTFSVSEFLRISWDTISKRGCIRHVPELLNGGLTPTGLPVQVQILGGDPHHMASSALVACKAGAKAIDINFGCPSPTVNRNDGGSTLLKYPIRIREIVRAIRDEVPDNIPVSAKLRLGWDDMDAILENADMAAEGGASWITIHGRTRDQRYTPPAYWEPIGEVRKRLNIPVVANGDIWSIDDFLRCRDITGCQHFMLGRGALANPLLSHQVAYELGLIPEKPTERMTPAFDWLPYLNLLVHYSESIEGRGGNRMLCRLKQWLMLASRHGCFLGFNEVKRLESTDELLAVISSHTAVQAGVEQSALCRL